MGTRTNSRQSGRRTKRGLASFVSFVLLFAFALGQSSLSALAEDAGTDPVAAEEAISDGSTEEGTVPVQEAPVEEAFAEEAPAEEAPAEEVPAAEADGDASTGAGAATAGAGEARKGQINVARTNRTTAIAAPAAPPGGSLDGGDIDLDFIAAGPFTYDHATGLGPNPPFGYNGRQISKSNGVVESLEAGDFECGDWVTFFTQITVDSGAGSGGTIELDYTYGAETTGQPGLGFDDIISVAVNTPDSGNKNLDGDEVATLIAEGFDSSGYDQVTGTVEIEGLDPGDVVIVRSIVELACLQGQSPTGNILNAIETGRVTSPENDNIQVGQQTVPMKSTGFVAEPAIDIEKICPATAAVGANITYTITITNNGNEDLENIVVMDTVDGHSAVNISNLFADTLAAGASDSAQFVYSHDPSDPDPLPNTVTVTADGVHSSAHVTDTDTCDTDITHEPGIDVEKTCPLEVPSGGDVTFTITVKNTGNEPLENVSVTDALLGGDITAAFNLPDPLPVGNTVYSHDFVYTPGANEDPVENSVTASGDGVDSGVTDTDTDECETDITHEPGIDVEKTCPLEVPSGGDVTFTITVKNTGNEPLENVSVTDALLGGDITAAFNLPDPLPVGNTVYSHDFVYTPGANEDPVENSVTASGDGVDSGVTDTDTDECETDITHEPGIDVEKTCPLEVPSGGDVTFTITVKNTGNEPLENVSVTDALLGGDITAAFNLPDPLPVGNTVYSHDFVYTPGANEDPVENSVTASGDGVDSGVTDTDTDECETDILNPSIGVTKSCTELAHAGDTVTYTITVTNTGDEDLDNVKVMDTILGDLSASFADELAVGASESHDFDYVVLESDPDPLVNEVTAKGSGVGSRVAVEALANCVTDLIHPAIEIVKTVDEDTVPIGTTVTYTYIVTNTGDTTLYDISVDDDILGHIGDIAVLEPGESATLTKDFVVGDVPVTNVGTATGEDILGRSVSSDDTAVVTPIAGATPPNPPTPFTGSDAGRLGIISMVLFGIGVTVIATTRKRRPEREAA